MEDKKLNIFFIISSALALISAVYVFYFTVFNQIISQNQGYFYALIFGFILLIAFVLCNLFTKLIAISVNKHDSLLRRLAIIAVLVVIAVVFLFSRMRYSTSVSPDEYPIYKSAIAMINGTYSQSHDLVNDALINPGHFLYSLILSLFIRIFGEGTLAVLWLNAVLYIVCGYLAYKITELFTDRVCGVFAASLALFIPSQTFGVYTYSGEGLVGAIILGCFLSYSVLFLYDSTSGNENIEKNDEEKGTNGSKPIIALIISAVMTGIMILAEPVMIIPVVLIVVAGFCLKKEQSFKILISFAAGVVIFALLCFAKSVYMQSDIGEVIGKEFSAFDALTKQSSGAKNEFSKFFADFNADISSTEEKISDNYYFITDSAGINVYTELNASWIIVVNQIFYMFTLVMTISCIILSVKEKKDEASLVYSALFGTFALMFFTQYREGNEFVFAQMLIIASAVGIHYLYLDHHPEQKVNLNALDALEKTGRKELAKATRSNLQAARSMDEEDFVKRAEALIFVDSDEDLYKQIKIEEHKNAMTKDGHANVFDETYDDYDEDFFLDIEDDVSDPVKVTAVAPSGITEREGSDAYEVNANMHAAAKFNKESVPAWKLKQDDYDSDYFDEEDDYDKDFDDNSDSDSGADSVAGSTENAKSVDLSARSKAVATDKKAKMSFSGKKSLVKNVGVTTSEPEPEVTTIKRRTNGKKVVLAAPVIPDVPEKKVKAAKLEKSVKTEKTVKPTKAAKAEKAAKPAKAVKAEKPAKVTKVAKAAKPEKAVKVDKSVKSGKAVSTATNTINNGRAVRRVKTVGTKHAVPQNVAQMNDEDERFIPNPLPLPKKREHTGMDYDVNDFGDDDV